MAQDELTIRDKVAIVGIGETAYYRRGGSPVSEIQLCVEAIKAAVADAGLQMTDIDGFASYAADRNDPVRLSTLLGMPRITFSNMYWGGGGGGGSGAVANAAAAVVAGYANYVVAYRSLAQGEFGRFGQARGGGAQRFTGAQAFTAPYGYMTPAQTLAAMQAQRHMYEFGTKREHFGAIALASYKHANRNPRAVMYERKLSMDDYLNSRWICEPLCLYDCCLETDGAAAVVITSAERARDLPNKPAYLLAAAQGSAPRRPFTGTNHDTIADDLWRMAGIGPQDVDVAQCYENFTPLVLMTLEDYGFCQKGEGGDFVQDGRIEWPDGDLPVNTSGGNLAEAYTHGFELITEAVRQIRGTSTSQVEGVEVSFVASGPNVSPVSSLVMRG
ncbi:MAG TPA: acetyl-CoA acetyltransferase [Dehalococcoidia bacterium]